MLNDQQFQNGKNPFLFTKKNLFSFNQYESSKQNQRDNVEKS